MSYLSAMLTGRRYGKRNCGYSQFVPNTRNEQEEEEANLKPIKYLSVLAISFRLYQWNEIPGENRIQVRSTEVQHDDRFTSMSTSRSEIYGPVFGVLPFSVNIFRFYPTNRMCSPILLMCRDVTWFYYEQTSNLYRSSTIIRKQKESIKVLCVQMWRWQLCNWII